MPMVCLGLRVCGFTCWRLDDSHGEHVWLQSMLMGVVETRASGVQRIHRHRAGAGTRTSGRQEQTRVRRALPHPDHACLRPPFTCDRVANVARFTPSPLRLTRWSPQSQTM